MLFAAFGRRACAGGDGNVAPTEVDEWRLDVAAQLLPAAVVCKSDDHTTAAAATSTTDGEAVRFTPRQYVSWGLPWVFLLGCMLIFALKYTHGSIWFSAFSVLVMAMPMTELFFIIYGMTKTNSDEEPPSPPDAEVGEQLVDSLTCDSTMTDVRSYGNTTQDAQVHSQGTFALGLAVYDRFNENNFDHRRIGKNSTL